MSVTLQATRFNLINKQGSLGGCFGATFARRKRQRGSGCVQSYWGERPEWMLATVSDNRKSEAIIVIS